MESDPKPDDLKLSRAGDDNEFESIEDEGFERAKRAAADTDIKIDSTGLGRFLLSGVTGAVGAVASLGGFGQKRGPEGTRGASEETTLFVVRESVPHKQTRSTTPWSTEKRTGPKLQVRIN